MTTTMNNTTQQVCRLLSDGRARTLIEIAAATKLPRDAVTRSLEKFPAKSLRHERQHRHHYYALVTSDATANTAQDQCYGPRDPRLRAARTCYGHFAGDLGIALSDALVRGEYLRLEEGGYRIAEAGMELFGPMGLGLNNPLVRDQTFKRCLDWSWRRPHIGGALGRALVQLAEQSDWIKRGGFHPRGVTVSDRGKHQLQHLLGISWPLTSNN